MKSATRKEEKPITVGQFARIEKDRRPGFGTRWLVDKQGCPACGNITKYELKPPTFPAVSSCKHFSRLTKKDGWKEDTWIFEYTYVHTIPAPGNGPVQTDLFSFFPQEATA